MLFYMVKSSYKLLFLFLASSYLPSASSLCLPLMNHLYPISQLMCVYSCISFMLTYVHISQVLLCVIYVQCVLIHGVLLVTPWTQPARLLCPWDSPGKNTGVGCHALLQGICPIQGSNLGPLHCRQILYRLRYQGSPEHRLTESNISLIFKFLVKEIYFYVYN